MLEGRLENNSHVRKNYFDSKVVENESAGILQHFPLDYFDADIYRSIGLHLMSSRYKICTLQRK